MIRFSKVKVRINRPATVALLRSLEVQADLKARAERIAAAAGPGFEVDTFVGDSRARADVATETWAARRAEAVDRRLSRAVNAGR